MKENDGLRALRHELLEACCASQRGLAADWQSSGVWCGWGTASVEKQEAELHVDPAHGHWHVPSVRTSIEKEEGPRNWPGHNWVEEPEDLDP